MYYTYLWLREDGTPYYVGKGTGKRAFVKHGNNLLPPVIENIIIQEFEREEDALFAEKLLISAYGRKDNSTGLLRNLTDGGEDPPKSKKGKRVSQQRRERCSKTLKLLGIKPPSRKNVPHSELSKVKISEFQKKYKKTPEHIQKVAESQRGQKRRPRTEEEKQHLSKMLKGVPWTPKRRAARATKGIRMADCHPDRKHTAKGLCRPCAFKKWAEDSGRKQKRRKAGLS